MTEAQQGDLGRDDARPVESPRGQHGGMPLKPDDEAYEQRVQEERVDLGVEDYDADAVPPVIEDPAPVDVTATPEYQEELDQVRRRDEDGELVVEGGEQEFPPTSYSS
jgi:hypothetical protein